MFDLRSARAHIVWETMVLRRPKRSVECSDSEKNMSAFADQNHAPSLTCVRLKVFSILADFYGYKCLIFVSEMTCVSKVFLPL